MTTPKAWNATLYNTTTTNGQAEETINQTQVKRKALIVSVSHYDDHKNLQPLEFCQRDGEEMHTVLKSLGYEIAENHKLIGKVSYEIMRKSIIDFFTNKNVKSKDTLLFYFSGHGIPEDNGEHYLATSEIDTEAPYDKGFSFYDLQTMINRSVSTRVVIILDCCYSGAAKAGYDKSGSAQEEAATLGREAINNRIKAGEGKCVLASSLSYQKSYASNEQGHSIFTYYLIDGLKGNKESVNSDGTITPDTLGRYVYHKVTEKLPKQKPLRKVESAGDIILAEHPELAEKPVVDIAPIVFEGNKYLNNENYSKAIELFDEAIKLNPKSHFAHIYKGYALLKLKKYDEAIKCYDAALEINPKEIDALKNKGLSLSNLSKYNEAIQCYDAALEIHPMDSKVWYYKGLALSNLSKYNEAIKCYNEAININPEYSDALRDKGLLEKFAKVVVLEEEPAPPPRADISLILDEGTQYFENGDYDNAIKSFDKAIELNPNSPVAYNYKGDVFFKLKNYEEAIKSYDAALEINPKYLDVLKDKGAAFDNLGKYHEAIDCFDAALEINPKIARNWYYKALALSKIPNNDEAVKCYDEVLRLEPNNVAAWIGKGICFGILKKYKEAIECYDRAVTIDPNNTVANEKKKAILQLISEETTKSRPQQQSSIITSISSPSSIQPIPSPSQQQSSPPQAESLHSHRTVATKDTPSSFSSDVKEDKRLLTNPKILIPIIAIVIGFVLALIVFGGVLPHNAIPAVNAGLDQIVNAGDHVTLDGSKSSDSDGNIVSYLWKQIGDPIVVLNNPNTASPSFTAPTVTSDTKLIFNLTVKDDKDATSSKSDSVDIIVKPKTPPSEPINHPPVANNQSVTTSINKPVDITLTASDPDINNTLTAAIVSPPSNGRLSDIDQNTGNMSYTPNPGYTGTDEFTFKVNDGKVDSENNGTVKIAVNQPSEIINHPPVANNQSVTTHMSMPVNIQLSASDKDSKDDLRAAIVSTPLHGTLSEINQDTGELTYTPNPGYTGTDEFTFKVNDGKEDSINTAKVLITIK